MSHEEQERSASWGDAYQTCKFCDIKIIQDGGIWLHVEGQNCFRACPPERRATPRDTRAEAAHEVARSEAAKALQRAFPILCEDYTDQWFEKVVDTVLDTYREWTEE